MSYAQASTDALNRRLGLLADAWRRGIHTTQEHDKLRLAIIREHEQCWPKQR